MPPGRRTARGRRLFPGHPTATIASSRNGRGMDEVLNWAERHQTLLWWIGSGSAVALVVTLVAALAIAVVMPADFFVDREKHHMAWLRGRPALRVGLATLRNVLGGVFMLAGIAMLVLPGQGLLTIFIGLVLIDFPGKLRLEAWLIRKKGVHGPLNWIRAKAGRPPLRTPEAESRRKRT